MPIRITETTEGGTDYGHVTLGPVDHTVQIGVNLTGLTDKEIDKYGYLKPGVLFNKAGTLVTTGSAFGITIEAIKVAENNETATIAALPTNFQIGVATNTQIIQDVIEDNLDRAMTAAELASVAPGMSGLILL